MENSPESKRKKWSKEETNGLLICYGERKEEFDHPRGQAKAYKNVLEDMISKGVTDSSTTTKCLDIKMRTLLNSYKQANDNNRMAGATPCHTPYMEQLEQIFGDKPTIVNRHKVNIGWRQLKPIQPSTSLAASSTRELSEEPSMSRAASSSREPSAEPSISSVTSSSRESSISPNAKSLISSREAYYEKILRMKQRALDRAEQTRKAAFQRLEEHLKKKWVRELELEEKKLEIRQKLLDELP